MEFYDALPTHVVDIMLEVKDKNLSAVKCLNCISREHNPVQLHKEWARYKYSALERSSDYHAQIEELLSCEAYPVHEFYHLIEQALAQPC